MAGEEPSGTLPGYVGLPSAGATYSLVETVTAVRMEGEFLVRNASGVQSIKDGYIVKRADGSVYGVEANAFNQKYLVFSNNPPGASHYGLLWLDPLIVGVALGDVTWPQVAHEGANLVSSTKTGGTLPTGVTYNGTTLVGTPAADQDGVYFLELTHLWDDGESTLSVYVQIVYPPLAP